MRLTYVLPLPELSGGNKVALQHAELLRSLGHEVTVLGEGPSPSWSRYEGPYLDYSSGPPRLPDQDLVIATYWTTLAVAERFDLGPPAHFCQGFEGGFPHLEPQHAAIEAAYARSVPTLVVSPHLGELLLRRFGTESRLVPPPLDSAFRPRLRRRPRRRPWIALGGIFQAEVKGIRFGLEAAALLRERGIPCRLLRYSPEPMCPEEKEILEADRYLCRVSPETIARELPACDLLLMPSMPEEGFGLPLLEAMASKVPAIASRIPSAEYITDGRLPLPPAADAAALADRAEELLRDASRWRRARRVGHEQAGKFAPERIRALLAEAVAWAAG